MTRRLFCFSIYSRHDKVDSYVLYFLKELAKCGDVIVYADNNNYEESLQVIKQISPNILYAGARRHGEYDFGSYKYCILEAEKLHILDNYDYIYFCNDSVIGPLCDDFNKVLENLENQHTSIITMYEYKATGLTGPQSWFVGFTKGTQKKVIRFLKGVVKQDHKDDVVLKYEHGLGRLLLRDSIAAETSSDGLENFFAVEEFLEEHPNYPFIKKRALCYIKNYKLEEFVYKYIKNKELADSIIDIIPDIEAHEKELTPKYRGGAVITRLTKKQYTIHFDIPPVDPAKKKEQEYF